MERSRQFQFTKKVNRLTLLRLFNVFLTTKNNFSQRLVSDELEVDEPDTVDIDAESVDLLKESEFLPRHFQFPKTEDDLLIDEMEEANGMWS